MKKGKRYHETVHRRSMEKKNARDRQRVTHKVTKQKVEKDEEKQLTDFFAIHLSSLIRRWRAQRGTQKSFERRKT